MNPIPPMVQDLIWQIAEEGDLDAVREFETRYPDFVPELHRRMSLVRQMRLARPNSPTPRFELPVTPSARGWPRSAVAVVGLLGASLVFATVMFVSRPAPRANPAPSSAQSPGAGEDQPTVQPWGPREVPIQPQAGPGEPSSTQAPPPNTPVSAFEKTVELDSSGTMLSQAIQSIATQAGLRLTIAPLFEDKEIEAHYSGLSAKQVLDDLGQNFGFTVVVQQGNEALIVPALDPSRPPVNIPNDSYSLPTENE